MRAAQAKVDQLLVWRGQHHAGGLGGDHRLKLHEVDRPRLKQLGLRQGSGDAHQRFLGKADRALGQGMHLAGEAKRAQVIQQLVAETRAGQHCQLAFAVAQRLDGVEQLLESGRDQKAALARQLADEQLKDRLLGQARCEVALHHGELVQVGQ